MLSQFCLTTLLAPFSLGKNFLLLFFRLYLAPFFCLISRVHIDEKGQKQDLLIDIEQWDTAIPDPKEFAVPTECSASNNGAAVLTRPFVRLVKARAPLLRKLIK